MSDRPHPLRKKDIAQALDEARRELLDLGMRNPLINFRRLRARGVHIVDERSEEVYRILVEDSKAMSFLPAVDGEPDDDEDLFEQPEEESEALAERHIDLKLQTPHASNKLQKRLLNTYYAARTYIEEQGVNVLYLALGMLHWYESPSSDKKRQAPLVLIPVELYRTSVNARFRLTYNGEDIGDNLSLAAKLKGDFGITLPQLDTDAEQLDLRAYVRAVEAAIATHKRWQVEAHAIELGFFSFGKFLMYNDLNVKEWPADALAEHHPVLTHLLREGFPEANARIGEDDLLDDHLAPHDVNHVVDADSTQMLALVDALDGHNLVIQGPPGTGKSQTITNLIAEALGAGKRVLFVSEKMAALEVVKRRLDTVGIGDACLELHSHKTRKKALLQELQRTLKLGRPKLNDNGSHDLDRLEATRAQLNAYSIAVNMPIGGSGISPYRAFGASTQLQKQVQEATGDEVPRVRDPALRTWTAADIRRRQDLAVRAQDQLAQMGVPKEHPWYGTRRTVFLPEDKPRLRDALHAMFAAVEGVQRTSHTLAEYLQAAPPTHVQQIPALCSAAQAVLTAPKLDGIAVEPMSWIAKVDHADALLAKGERWMHVKQQFRARLIPEAWTQQVLDLRTSFKAHGEKWYRFLIGDFRRAKVRLEGLCAGAMPTTNDKRLALVEAILETQRLGQELEQGKTFAQVHFGTQWEGLRSTWETLRYIRNWMLKVAQHGETVSVQIVDVVRQQPDLKAIGQALKAVTENEKTHAEAAAVLKPLLDLDTEVRFGNTETLANQTFAALQSCLSAMLEELNRLQEMVALNHVVEAMRTEAMGQFVPVLLTWAHAPKHFAEAVRFNIYDQLISQALETRPVLARFDGASHSSAVKRFRQLDAGTFHYNRVHLANTHWKNIPRRGSFGQMSVLRHEMQKKRRHLPIRKLITQAGRAIQAIKPVFMMSPMSIATYLPPGSVTFDLVVFDEASQVKPVDAFGAILRGQQAVVVGDTKQLPPTSFFDTVTTEIEEEEEVYEARVSDVESILALFASKGAPERMLRWHYRSRHDSLIAVSNKEFYSNRLVTFPSPDSERRTLGLRYHHLPDTFYDRGGSRANRGEAVAVAQAVLDHAQTNPDLTLGVAAFSQAQAEAVVLQVERLRRANPSTESFFGSHPDEPFFVKNLENVQGDERDVIFISIGYGRDQHGRLSLNFGPLNREGGERRLNVLITRARRRCEVFTNLQAEDISLASTKARGVAALKRYLQYAATGKLEMAEVSDRPPDSPFEEDVAHALRRHGYEVHHQVGSAGYFVDLAVVHPKQPGHYMLGIECDGATYHSARSARDRDRIRQSVLEGLGWRIHRIWSTDWFRNPDRELRKVRDALEREKARALVHHQPLIPRSPKAQPAAAPKAEKMAPTLQRHDHPEDASATRLSTPYAAIQLTSQRMHGDGLHEVYVGKLGNLLQQVIQKEAPVHFEEAARRMLEAYGVKQMGRRIRQHLQRVVKHGIREGWLVQEGDFLYDPEMTTCAIRDRSTVEARSKKLDYVAPQELDAAIMLVVRLAHGISAEAIPPEACALLGFSRVTSAMRARVDTQVRQLVDDGALQQKGALVFLSE